MLPGMRNATTPECPNCKRLAARVAELEARIGLLEKNSSNSHKPPSSDIVKPKKPKAAKGKRRIGAQPGHPKHQRKPFGPEELDAAYQYTLQQCPDCGGRLKRARCRDGIDVNLNIDSQKVCRIRRSGSCTAGGRYVGKNFGTLSSKPVSSEIPIL